ncbi:hypothetical protein [Blastopirellula retiformator]|uniref:Uncharacterized protein n=1 Tax=Blastopirellula retiformator TaxID=2527970 RepID=A0A5C5VJE9_9BACT|nr:hypothetical protein [Blastopirellula retiformator]TWT38736.1 hypothetical protein Enr8_04300 [Blastopirellula retiformator]
MESDASQNPFASPHASQKARHDVPTYIEAMTPIDVRGYCYACGGDGEEEFQQTFYRGRLQVNYTLCRSCRWRLPWQRASLSVNAALPVMALAFGGFIATFLLLGRLVSVYQNPLQGNDDFLLALFLIGTTMAIFTGGLVVANIVLRRFAVFHWYPTSIGNQVYRLTALNRQFRLNYFKAEQES